MIFTARKHWRKKTKTCYKNMLNNGHHKHHQHKSTNKVNVQQDDNNVRHCASQETTKYTIQTAWLKFKKQENQKIKNFPTKTFFEVNQMRENQALLNHLCCVAKKGASVRMSGRQAGRVVDYKGSTVLFQQIILMIIK